MSEDDEALSLSEMPAVKNKIIKRKLSYDKLLKNKYINYTEEELIQMNDTRKDEILEIDEKNKKLKEELTKTIEKLNLLITSNSDILFQDQKKNMTEIENLEKIFYLRKHDHTLSIKYNTTFKQQYNALKIRAKNLGDENKISEKILSDKNFLEKLKNENFDLNKKIQEQQFSNIKHTKELENSNFIQKSENNLQSYANILSNISLTRFDYHDKIENKKKSVEQLKQQFNNLNEYINKNKNKIIENDKDEIAMTKINSELEILKKDLSKEVDDIIQNCYDNKISLVKEENISSNNNSNSNSNNNNNNNNNNSNNNTSFNNNKSDYNSKNTLNKSNSIQKLEIKNNSRKLNPVKNIGRSQSSLFKLSIQNNTINNNNYLNNLTRKKSIDTSVNKKNFSIFTKFKILKSTKPLKIGSSSSINPMKNVSMFVTKEVIDFNKKSEEEEQLDKEIKKIEQNDYQQLIDLKGNYVDTNDRLLRDIKEKKKICFNRIKHLTICIENNMAKLKQIKESNEIMKKELDNYEQKIKKKMEKTIKKEEKIINNEKLNENNQNENENENKNENEKVNENNQNENENENKNEKDNKNIKDPEKSSEKIKEKRRRKKK